MSADEYKGANVEIVTDLDQGAQRCYVNGTDVGLMTTAPVVAVGDRQNVTTVTLVLMPESVVVHPA